MSRKHKCDCHLHKHQVCDVCQGVKGKKLRDVKLPRARSGRQVTVQGALRILRKTADSGDERVVKSVRERLATPSMTFNEVMDAHATARQQLREGWKDLSVEKTVSPKGVVRRKNINYGRDTSSKLLPKITGKEGPLYSLNRLLGLSEINQGLIEIQSGDLPSIEIPVTVHLPQANQVISTVLIPRFRFGKGLRRNKTLRAVMSGKKRMVLTELGSDSDTPQLQITFY